MWRVCLEFSLKNETKYNEVSKIFETVFVMILFHNHEYLNGINASRNARMFVPKMLHIQHKQHLITIIEQMFADCSQTWSNTLWLMTDDNTWIYAYPLVFDQTSYKRPLEYVKINNKRCASALAKYSLEHW